MDVIKIIKKMQDNTSKRGFNFILCMSNNELEKKKGNFYPLLEELKNLYPNWDVKSEEFETDLEEHDGFQPHKHNLIISLAKKLN